MKTVLCLLAATALLCGCNQQSDPNIVQLQHQVDLLAATSASLQTACANLQADSVRDTNAIANCLLLEGRSQAALAAYAGQTTNITRLWAAQALLDKQLTAVEAALGDQDAAKTVTDAKTLIRMDTADVPPDILSIAGCTAVQLWPKDYELQNYTIKLVSDAWVSLNPR